jgi:YVTN family beta-propeller protein
MTKTFPLVPILLICAAVAQPTALADEGTTYRVCISNERSGDVSMIDGTSRRVLAKIPVGKRPRGVHVSRDGKYLYVALSGTPITGPPPLDTKGAPIFKPDNNEEDADHSADGIGVVDLQTLKFLRKLPAGSDPEEFAVSSDGSRLYVSNEDVATASVINVADGKVERIFRVQKEPEGIALSPDGRFLYVTCETGGEVVVIDNARNKKVAEILIGGRPRSVAFLPGG